MRINVWLLILLMLVLPGCQAGLGDELPREKAGSEAAGGLRKDAENALSPERDTEADIFRAGSSTFKTPPNNSAVPEGSGYCEARIDLLTEEDMDAILAKLEAEGYLGEAKADVPAICSALTAYQSQHQLPVTGKLDTITIKHLRENS